MAEARTRLEDCSFDFFCGTRLAFLCDWKQVRATQPLALTGSTTKCARNRYWESGVLSRGCGRRLAMALLLCGPDHVDRLPPRPFGHGALPTLLESSLPACAFSVDYFRPVDNDAIVDKGLVPVQNSLGCFCWQDLVTGCHRG